MQTTKNQVNRSLTYLLSKNRKNLLRVIKNCYGSRSLNSLPSGGLWLAFLLLLTIATTNAQVNGEITKTTASGGGTVTIAGTDLNNAISTSGVPLSDIKELELNGGNVVTADWNYLKTNSANFTAMTHFTVTNAITSVANIPHNDTTGYYFNNSIEHISVAKVRVVGRKAFEERSNLKTVSCPEATAISELSFWRCTNLTTVNFPEVSYIGYFAFDSCRSLTSVNFPEAILVSDSSVSIFNNCSSLTTVSLPRAFKFRDHMFAHCTNLTTLKLDATPPDIIPPNVFLGTPSPRSLILVDANGTPLTGTALKTAINNYRAVTDGNTTDNLWYGWEINSISPTTNILYVNKNVTAGGLEDGSSWANAVPELADALKWANMQPTAVQQNLKIYVAKGIYKPLYRADNMVGTNPADRNNAFVLVNKVKIYGGFDPDNGITDLTHTRILPSFGGTGTGTILSGDLDNSNTINNADSYHVVISVSDNATTLLDGFTITGGNANSISSIAVESQVIYSGYSGGMFNYSSSLRITNCIFSSNTTHSKGGGMYNYDSSPIITNCSFISNRAHYTGGGMHNTNYSSPIITNCSFISNISNLNGGGMYNYDSSPIITNCTFSSNTAANNEGGGMYNFYNSSPKIYNSIFWDNKKGTNNNIAGVDIENNFSSQPSLVHSLLQLVRSTTNYPTSFTFASTDNNIYATDPLFVDASNGDFSLQLGSPAINAGTSSATILLDKDGNPITLPTTDLDGNARIKNINIDMGAYEYQNTFTGWTGTTDTTWSNTSNWNGGVPTSTTETYIYDASNQPVLDVNGQAKELTLLSNTSITVNAGKGLTVENNLTNNGTVTVNSNATSSGSLVVKGNAIGNLTYNRYVHENPDANINTWHLVGAPVIGQSIHSFATDTNNNLRQNTANTLYAIAPYNNSFVSPNVPWEYIPVANITTAGNFENGKGYGMLRGSSGTFNFTGTYKNNDAQLFVNQGTNSSWNLIANPYPAFIPLSNAGAVSNFLVANASVIKASNLAVFMWDGTTNEYKPFNHLNTTATNAFIAPGQGFFVEVKDGGGMVSIPKSMLTHQTGDLFLRNTPRFEMQLQLTNGEATKSTEIIYAENMTTGLDVGYDAGIFIANNEILKVYTELVNNDGNPYALQALPPQNYEEMIIPVGVLAKAGKTITFSMEAKNIPNGITIYLEDKQKSTFTQLNDSENYKVKLSQPETGIGRFYLHTSSKALSNENIVNNTSNIQLYLSEKNTLTIHNLKGNKATLQLFDLLGKEVQKTEFTIANKNQIQLKELPTAVYIAKVKTQYGVKTKKIVIE